VELLPRVYQELKEEVEEEEASVEEVADVEHVEVEEQKNCLSLIYLPYPLRRSSQDHQLKSNLKK
jgi:hypothetical protein